MLIKKKPQEDYADLHKEIQAILKAVQMTAEGVTEQNNNLFMKGYEVGYNDAYVANAELKLLLLKTLSIIKNVETTLSCKLLDEDITDRINKIMGDLDV